jgi:LAGLIDADG endonuclease
VIIKTLIDAGTGFLNSYSTFWIQDLCIYFMSMLFYRKLYVNNDFDYYSNMKMFEGKKLKAILKEINHLYIYTKACASIPLLTVLQNKVKIMYTIAQPAGLGKNLTHNWGATLLCLQFFLLKALLFEKNIIYAFQRFYNTYTNPQRLNSKDLMWFVGFVEADGSFSINKNGKYAKYEFCIELSKRDVQLIYKIKSMLGIGSITFRTRNKSEMVRLKIASKTDLILTIIPIFDKYNMLTNKHFDFIHFKSCLLSNIVYYRDIPVYTRPKDSFLKVEEILKVLYFDCWLVGFIEAESSFTTYIEKEHYETSSFEISQTNALEVIIAIKKRLSISANAYLYESNYKLQTTSTRGIQNVINFLKQTPAKLKGYKRAQYLKWLHSIRANPKYINVNVPFKY